MNKIHCGTKEHLTQRALLLKENMPQRFAHAWFALCLHTLHDSSEPCSTAPWLRGRPRREKWLRCHVVSQHDADLWDITLILLETVKDCVKKCSDDSWETWWSRVTGCVQGLIRWSDTNRITSEILNTHSHTPKKASADCRVLIIHQYRHLCPMQQWWHSQHLESQ